MTIKSFEEIIAWQKARRLSLLINRLLKTNRDFAFRSQIWRASISVMNNIAEGFERNTNKEFRQFLYISKGSCGEIKSMLYLAKDLKYIDQNSFTVLSNLSNEISRMLYTFIKKL